MKLLQLASLVAAASLSALSSGANAQRGFFSLCDGLCGRGMVLPVAPQRARVWGSLGYATPEPLEVIATVMEGAGGSKALAAKTHTERDGSWSVTFEQGLPSMAEATLLLQARAAGQAAVQHERMIPGIAVGQLWLCAGQSNMQYRVSGFGSGNVFERPAEDMEKYNIRQITVPEVEIFEEQDSLPSGASWSPVTPATVGRVSAMCLYTAQHYLDAHPGMTLGLLISVVGSTTMTHWAPPVAINRCGLTEICEQRRFEATRVQHSPVCGVFYFGMVHPVLKLDISKILWYQGETGGDIGCLHGQVAHAFREKLAEYNGYTLTDPLDVRTIVPYLYVELAPGNIDYTSKRQQQRAVLLEEPWARFVSTLDLGGPGGTIHPARKLEIGRRAAAELLEVEARVAGLSAASLPSVAVSADTLGPMLHPMQPPVLKYNDETRSVEVRLTFTNDRDDPTVAAVLKREGGALRGGLNGGGKLHAANTADCENRGNGCCPPSVEVEGGGLLYADSARRELVIGRGHAGEAVFEVAFDGHVLVGTDFTIYPDSHEVLVSAKVPEQFEGDGDDVLSHVSELFYGWHMYPVCALFNGVGGPDDHTATVAPPFRVALSDSCTATTTVCEGAATAFGGRQCCTQDNQSGMRSQLTHAGETCRPAIGCTGTTD